MHPRPPRRAFSALFSVPPPRVLEDIHHTLTTQDHPKTRSLVVHMEVANLLHLITRHKEARVQSTKMKRQNQAISVHPSIMVAKKIMPQIQKPLSKKDGGDNDPNGSSASRGNWWQGSLYY
ncbi:hypothetical protein Hanom_Chr07g00673241 [Helianthus anomalus]